MPHLGDDVGDGLIVDAISVPGGETFRAVDVADKAGIWVAPRDSASRIDGVAAIVGKLIEDPVLERRIPGTDRHVAGGKRGGKSSGFAIEAFVLDCEKRIQIQRSWGRDRGDRPERRTRETNGSDTDAEAQGNENSRGRSTAMDRHGS